MKVIMTSDFPHMEVVQLRNNSWKPYVYTFCIVFSTGRPIYHEVLPRALAKGKKLT
jgi:hypothetical protein